MVAFVVLGVSAGCGAVAAKLYVSYLLAGEGLAEVFDADDPQVLERKRRALQRGGAWALRQQLLFAAGGLLAGIFLIVNLL